MWLIVRLAVVLGMSIGLLSVPTSQSNFGWGAGALVGLIAGINLYFWLWRLRDVPGVIRSRPYSWFEPFWPMQKYPVRFWIVSSYSLMLAGITTAAWRRLADAGASDLGAGCFLMGLLCFGAVALWIMRNGRAATE